MARAQGGECSLALVGVPGKLTHIIKTGILGVGTGVAIYFLNKRAVNKQIMPRLAKVDELITVMERA